MTKESLSPPPWACRNRQNKGAQLRARRSADGTDDLSLALFDGAPPDRGAAADIDIGTLAGPAFEVHG
jgi:hypothetical protein